mgnify:CR=1 FL=1
MRLAGMIGGAARGLVAAGQPIVMEGIREKAVAKRDARLQEYDKEKVAAAATATEEARLQGITDDRAQFDYELEARNANPAATADQINSRWLVEIGRAENLNEASGMVMGQEATPAVIAATRKSLLEYSENNRLGPEDEFFVASVQDADRIAREMYGMDVKSGSGTPEPEPPKLEVPQAATPEAISYLKGMMDEVANGTMTLEEVRSLWEPSFTDDFDEAVKRATSDEEGSAEVTSVGSDWLKNIIENAKNPTQRSRDDFIAGRKAIGTGQPGLISGLPQGQGGANMQNIIAGRSGMIDPSNIAGR